MKAGLPGVGIGGVFYVLLVAWMPFHEIWLTLQGRSSPRRWRRIAGQGGLAAGIVAGLGVEWWSLARLPLLLVGTWRPSFGQLAADPGQFVADLEYVASAVAAVPVGIIALLCIGLQLSRLAARAARRTSDDRPVLSRRRAPTLAVLAEQRRLRDTLRRRGEGGAASEAGLPLTTTG